MGYHGGPQIKLFNCPRNKSYVLTSMGLESGQVCVHNVRCLKLLGEQLWWPAAKVPSYLSLKPYLQK